MKVKITAMLFEGFFPKSLSVSKRFERSLRVLVDGQEEKRLRYSSQSSRRYLKKDGELQRGFRINSTLSCVVKDIGEADAFEDKFNAIVSEAEWRKEPDLRFETEDYIDTEEADAESTDSEKTKDSA